MDGSYQRARAWATAASVGSVLLWFRHASSKGPPVQRIGTQASGVGRPEAPILPDNSKSAISPWDHVSGSARTEIDRRRRISRELARFLRIMFATQVTTDSPERIRSDHGKGGLLEDESSITSLRDQFERICD